MIQQQAATIFLGDERGLQQTAAFQRRHTFNFGNYFSEHRRSLGTMYVLNDDILAGGACLLTPVQEDSFILLLPVAGAVNYKDTNGYITCIAAGQVQLVTAYSGDAIAISNPFREEMVNCLQVWIRRHPGNIEQPMQLYTYEDVNKNINQLVDALPATEAASLPFFMGIGKFSGRGETLYHRKKTEHTIFIFVIAGAFEVEGRLLHAGDGLALWHTSSAAMEALSNDALVLVLELPA